LSSELNGPAAALRRCRVQVTGQVDGKKALLAMIALDEIRGRLAEAWKRIDISGNDHEMTMTLI